MSRLTNPGATSPLEVYTTNSNPGGTYNYADPSFDTYTGQKFSSPDGREWAIVANAGTALAAGKLVSSPAASSNHIGRTVASFTAYSANGNQPATVTFTVGNTAVLSNEYARGYLIVETNTGAGQTLKVASNTACAASGTVTVTLENPDGRFMTALDTTSTVSLYRNPYGSGQQFYNNSGTAQSLATGGVIISAHASPTLNVIGASTYIIPASSTSFASFGLIQTAGRVNLLNDANTSAGLDIMPSVNTDGAFATYAVASGARIGTAIEAGTSTQYSLVNLQL